MQSYLKHYIDGEWVESEGGTRRHVINPSTEAPVSEVVLGSQYDVDRAVNAARRAFVGYSQTTVEQRVALIERIIRAYEARIPDLALAISEEVGAPIDFATEEQVSFALTHFTGMTKTLRDFAFSEEIDGARVVLEPIGVAALITPWNWPLVQICAKLVPAIAAGNTVVLKPSEEAPGAAAILAEVLHEAGVPAGVFNLVNGDGKGVGAALSRHPGVDMVSFTGSTAAGVAVAKSAAETVKRVHQELGGKAPNLVLRGSDLTKVLPPTVAGILANSGQTCVAPTRLLVHKSQSVDAADLVRGIFEATDVDASNKRGKHIGPVINERQYQKIQELIQSALDEGATLVAGGLGRPDGRNVGYYIRPTVLANVTRDMRIFREEIFGPVGTITVYDTLDEAVELANDTPYGLSAVISGDPVEAARVAPRLRAGLVTINRWLGTTSMAFGGYKQSGNGREGGKYGLADFMELKSIVGEQK